MTDIVFADIDGSTEMSMSDMNPDPEDDSSTTMMVPFLLPLSQEKDPATSCLLEKSIVISGPRQDALCLMRNARLPRAVIFGCFHMLLLLGMMRMSSPPPTNPMMRMETKNRVENLNVVPESHEGPHLEPFGLWTQKLYALQDKPSSGWDASHDDIPSADIAPEEFELAMNAIVAVTKAQTPKKGKTHGVAKSSKDSSPPRKPSKIKGQQSNKPDSNKKRTKSHKMALELKKNMPGGNPKAKAIAKGVSHPKNNKKAESQNGRLPPKKPEGKRKHVQKGVEKVEIVVKEPTKVIDQIVVDEVANSSPHQKRRHLREGSPPRNGASKIEITKKRRLQTVIPPVPLEGTSTRISQPTETKISQQPERARERPVMYTFYSEIGGIKQTGMTSAADNQLLTAWKQVWKEHGWEPRVIGLDAAEQHPHYAQLNALLSTVDFSTYERFCFLRWIAMSVVGGGWMSDYDTFPLYAFDPTMPSSGRLTVHEHSKNGGVPDLVSGSPDEWFRMAKVLIENAAEKKDKTWSDMFALHDVYVASNGTIYNMETHVVPGHVVLRKSGIEDRTCRRTRNKYAIHFSHYSMEFGTTLKFGSQKEVAGPQERASVALDWLTQWRLKCKGINGGS